MSEDRVLVICDNPHRKHYLEHHIRVCGLYPIWYPNIMAAHLAIRADRFRMLIVDLGIPVEPKINLIKETMGKQAGIPIITIGKIEYLESTNPFPSYMDLIKLSSIEAFPELLRQYTRVVPIPPI